MCHNIIFVQKHLSLMKETLTIERGSMKSIQLYQRTVAKSMIMNRLMKKQILVLPLFIKVHKAEHNVKVFLVHVHLKHVRTSLCLIPA